MLIRIQTNTYQPIYICLLILQFYFYTKLFQPFKGIVLKN